VENPWRISRGQAAALDAVIKTGCHKLAARELDISVAAVEEHIQRARVKMGTNGRILHILQWDRWRQGPGRGVPA
jgi:hypothetical protein